MPDRDVSSKHASGVPFHKPSISSFCFVAVASMIQKEKPSNLGSFRLVLLRSSLSSPLEALNCKQPEKCLGGGAIFFSLWNAAFEAYWNLNPRNFDNLRIANRRLA